MAIDRTTYFCIKHRKLHKNTGSAYSFLCFIKCMFFSSICIIHIFNVSILIRVCWQLALCASLESQLIKELNEIHQKSQTSYSKTCRGCFSNRKILRNSYTTTIAENHSLFISQHHWNNVTQMARCLILILSH